MFSSELNTPKPELDLRIRNLQHYLIENDIDAALVLQRVDLFYFSGTFQQGSLPSPGSSYESEARRGQFAEAAGNIP